MFTALKTWNPVNRFNHSSLVAFVTPTDRPMSVRNRCVIEVFGGVFVLSRCLLDFSVGVGAFVIGLSQISFFFSVIKVMAVEQDSNILYIVNFIFCL